MALLAITAIWGWTFIIVKQAVARMPVMDFLAIRFTVATLLMVVLRPVSLRNITGRGLWRASVLGVVLGLAYITQTYGLLSASAAVVGFITGMFVVLTPFIAWIWLRHKINGNTWVAVVLAGIGLVLLGLHGWSIGVGELLTLGCALFLAVHIVGLGKWSSQHEPYSFALMQIAAVAVLLIVAAVPGGITLPPDTGIWVAIGVTAILATALAFLVQTWAQSILSPTHAAVVMTMEPVFAGVFAVVIGGEHLTWRIAGGAASVLMAMFIVRLRPAAPGK